MLGVEVGGGHVEGCFWALRSCALEGVGVVGLREEPRGVVEAVERIVEAVVEEVHAGMSGRDGE